MLFNASRYQEILLDIEVNGCQPTRQLLAYQRLIAEISLRLRRAHSRSTNQGKNFWLWNDQNVILCISRHLNTWCYKLQLHCELLLVNQRTRKMPNVRIDDSTYFFYKYLLS